MSGQKCYRCTWHKESPEGGGGFRSGEDVFDVEAALYFAEDGREPVEFTHEQLIRLYGKQRWSVYRPHVSHVDTTKPGIMGRRKGDGRFIMEGLHRTTNRIYAGRPFKFYVLTERETEVCRRLGNAKRDTFTDERDG